MARIDLSATLGSQLYRPAAVIFVDASAPAQPPHLIHLVDRHFRFVRLGDRTQGVHNLYGNRQRIQERVGLQHEKSGEKTKPRVRFGWN